MRYPKFWARKSFFSTLLLPFSLIFSFISWIRRLLVKPVSLGVPVICVGNITVGGTGKTQVVEWLIKKLDSKKVLVICKGYKGRFKNSCLVQNDDSPYIVGDEPKILSKITDVIITRDFKNLETLIQKIKPDFIILDDFLQNPGIIKNVGIVVIDADRMFGNGRIIPAGPLRQTLRQVEFNTNIYIAIGSSFDKPRYLDDDVFFAQITSSRKFDMTKRYIAFAGIGNPDRFFKCLGNLNLVHKISFDDHYYYTSGDIDNLNRLSEQFNAELITTPKDAVKLHGLLKFEVFEPELNFSAEGKLISKIYEEIQKNKIFN